MCYLLYDLQSGNRDKQKCQALRKANVYGWENLDEVNEIQVDADLTFVGDFSNDFELFKNYIGHLHCIRTHDKRFYAFADNQFTNHETGNPWMIQEYVLEIPGQYFVCPLHVS